MNINCDDLSSALEWWSHIENKRSFSSLLLSEASLHFKEKRVSALFKQMESASNTNKMVLCLEHARLEDEFEKQKRIFKTILIKKREKWPPGSPSGRGSLKKHSKG